VIRLGLADDEPLFTMGLAMLLGAQPDMEVVWRAVDGNDALRRNDDDPVDVDGADGDREATLGVSSASMSDRRKYFRELRPPGNSTKGSSPCFAQRRTV